MRSSLARVRLSDWLVAAAGAGLLAVMFVDWYRVGGRTADAWQALTVIDVVVAIAAAIALALVAVAATQRTLALPTAWTSLTTLVAAVATVLVVIRTVSLPSVQSVAGAGASGHVTREAGVWLGLGFVLALVVAASRALADETIARPLRVPIHIERLPAPRADGGAAT